MYCNVLLCINSPGANDFHYPAAPDNLTVSFYYRSRYNCKYPALNISWKIRLDGKLYPCKRCQQICTLGQSHCTVGQLCVRATIDRSCSVKSIVIVSTTLYSVVNCALQPYTSLL